MLTAFAASAVEQVFGLIKDNVPKELTQCQVFYRMDRLRKAPVRGRGSECSIVRSTKYYSSTTGAASGNFLETLERV